MDLSVLLARIIAVIYISSGIGVITGKINFSAIANEFGRSPVLTYIAGTLAIITGTILVYYHNIWTMNWIVLITIISWMLFIGGIVIIISPRSLLYCKKFYRQSRLWGVFMVFFGLFFGYFGFFM
ncbi:MAG: hypothetical protein H7A26_08065 [Spirochaetales bacterium]|nr:hypothetical protein [Spirochaetales bacterium]